MNIAPNDPALWKGTSGPHDARIALVGESFGAQEAAQGKPFVGQSGELLRKMLGVLNINPHDCFMTNVVCEKPPGNDMKVFFYPTSEAKAAGMKPIRGLYPRRNVVEGLNRLHRQLLVVKPDLVIAFGNYSLWALTEDNFSVGNTDRRKVPTGITSWHGSQLRCAPFAGGYPLLPCYHPAAVLRQWPWYFALQHDLSTRVPLALRGEWDAPDWEFTVRPDYSSVMRILRGLLNLLETSNHPIHLSVDLETRAEHIACCGIAVSSTQAICVPFMCVENSEGYWTLEEEQAIVSLIRRILTHTNALVSGQNLLYDAQYMARYWGFVLRPHFDTMLAHHLCYPGTPKGLDHLSNMYASYHCYWKDDGKNWDASMDEEVLWVYNCRDATVTWEIAAVLEKLIDQLGLTSQWQEVMEDFHVTLDMMLRGIHVDLHARERLINELYDLQLRYESKFSRMLPNEVLPDTKKGASPWWRSPKQQMEIFYDNLGIAPLKNRKTGNPTLNDEALDRLKRMEPLLIPVVNAIQEYRSLGRFLDVCRAKLDPDNRMRSSFNLAGTETFRYSSSENAFGRGTNLQNISSGSEED